MDVLCDAAPATWRQAEHPQVDTLRVTDGDPRPVTDDLVRCPRSGWQAPERHHRARHPSARSDTVRYTDQQKRASRLLVGPGLSLDTEEVTTSILVSPTTHDRPLTSTVGGFRRFWTQPSPAVRSGGTTVRQLGPGRVAARATTLTGSGGHPWAVAGRDEPVSLLGRRSPPRARVGERSWSRKVEAAGEQDARCWPTP